MRGNKTLGTGRVDRRIYAVQVFFIFLAAVVIARLLYLQIFQHDFYAALASDQYDFYEELVAKRGSIFVSDWKDGQIYAAATNEQKGFLYADPRRIEDPEKIAQALAKALGMTIEHSFIENDSINLSVENLATNESETETDYELMLARLSKVDDPYEPIARGVDLETVKKIMDLGEPGISYVLEDARAYPEKNIGGHVFGFVQTSDIGGLIGRYGIEGYYNDFLAGKNGFLNSETDVGGSWISVGKRDLVPARDGGNLVLTIDRAIQYNACKILQQGVQKYEAASGSLIVLEPKTGKIMAMCNAPDFDPSIYSDVDDIVIYNNQAIFSAYEPGSVIKPLVMAGALDMGVLAPDSTYEDTGEVQVDGYLKPIKNSDLKAHGLQTMTEVLEKSLNTGMVFVMRAMGGAEMKKYFENFGFGSYTGIDLDTEVSGTLAALANDHEAFYAPASYGQGFTVSLLQIASAYGSLANNGWLMQPYIVEKKLYPDGTEEQIMPKKVRQVIQSNTAATIGAMLVSVVENGHSTKAKIDGFYIGGKTGTAQVADAGGGYGTLTNATFAGYGPLEDPRFVVVVRLEHPQAVDWAEDSAVPIFHDIAEYILNYLEVAPNR